MLDQQSSFFINERVFLILEGVKETTTDVLCCYYAINIQLSMLASFSRILFSIPLSQAGNERYFYPAALFTASSHSKLSVIMMYKLLFMNHNWYYEDTDHIKDILEGPVKDLNKFVDVL